MEDDDEHNKCEARFVHNVKIKAKYLYHVLAILLNTKEEESLLTWQNIYDLAIQKIKEFEGASLVENKTNNTHQFVVARTGMI